MLGFGSNTLLYDSFPFTFAATYTRTLQQIQNYKMFNKSEVRKCVSFLHLTLQHMEKVLVLLWKNSAARKRALVSFVGPHQ